MGYYCLIAMILLSLSAVAEDTSWLRHYDHRSRLIFYNDTSIVSLAARFEIPRPGHITTLRLKIGGNSRNGAALLHIYGSEGGMNAPLMERDLMRPITIRKTRSGTETITVELPVPVHVSGSQFFVMLDRIDPDIVLLSDRKAKKMACIGESGAYYSQMMKDKKGVWQWGKYGFAIDVGMKFGRSIEPALADVTKEAGFPDTPFAGTGIAWGDYNHDGFLDLLVGGRLFRNRGNGTFADVSGVARIEVSSGASGFIDADNDGHLDIFFVNDHGENHSLVLYRGDGIGNFTARKTPLPGVANLSSFSIADVNGDGYLDIFLGQSKVQSDSTVNLLLINDGASGFTPYTPPGAGSGTWLHIPSQGSQWVDYNNDGAPDLFIATAEGAAHGIFINDGAGQLFPLEQGREHGNGAQGIGCSWGDYDNDGDLDLLLPGPVPFGVAGYGSQETGGTIFTNRAGAEGLKSAFAFAEQEIVGHRAGGSWGDVNNDGLLDYLLTSSCSCDFIDLYLQTPDGGFERANAAYGLHRTVGGRDAVWADYDNDGRLDLAFFQDGRFKLLRNQATLAGGNHIQLDLLSGAGTSGGVGARVTVVAGDRRYTREVSSGRGLLMQDPLRLHVGIGNASAVDSVIVRWPGAAGVTETFTDLRVNAVNTVRGGRSTIAGKADGVRLEAYPNPFSASLTITYTLPANADVRLAIYSVTGEQICLLADRKEDAGKHVVSWSGTDAKGERLPQGTYIYRLAVDGAEMHGRAILAR